jgi:carbon storage regulator
MEGYMLVLSRMKNEVIFIGDDIQVKICDVRNGKVRVGILAPPNVIVHREEVKMAIERKRKASTNGNT